jgi:hypothetical protein
MDFVTPALATGIAATFIVCWPVEVFPQASVTIEYKVYEPAVGKLMLGLFPLPTEGTPPGLKLQFTERVGTPYCVAVEALIFPPAQIVLDETVKGVTRLVNSTV